MANCDNLFKDFNGEGKLRITKTKDSNLNSSQVSVRKRIKNYFKENYPKYLPTFYTQGSYKTGTTIRTKDDTCDMDDGVYFKTNPDNVSGTTLQRWVQEAVDGLTDAKPSHRKKCITVDFKAGYNIDLPVFVFNKNEEEHPKLAVKDSDFQIDDPKEFFKEVEKQKDKEGQLIRTIRYLKAWCDHKGKKMPSGLAMTVLAMNHMQKNLRDDISLKFTLIEIEKELKRTFKCIMPTTPKDNLFGDYDSARQNNFLNNLADFIADAKKAVDEEKNQLKASKLWKKHLGDKFPEGEDIEEKALSASLLSSTIGLAKPYCGPFKS